MKRPASTSLRLGSSRAAAVSVPVAGGASADVRLTCKSRALDVYFWPHGRPHPNTLELPAYRAPNLEVYAGGSVATKSFFLFVSATSYNYAGTCDLAINPLATRWGGGGKTTIATAGRVRCRFPWIAQVKDSAPREPGRQRPSRAARRLCGGARPRPDRPEGVQRHVRHPLLPGDEAQAASASAAGSSGAATGRTPRSTTLSGSSSAAGEMPCSLNLRALGARASRVSRPSRCRT